MLLIYKNTSLKINIKRNNTKKLANYINRYALYCKAVEISINEDAYNLLRQRTTDKRLGMQ